MPKRYFLTPILLPAFILISSFSINTIRVHINGHLTKNPKGSNAHIEHLNVFVKGDDKVLAQTVTNEKGDFNMTFTPEKEKSFDFYCSGVGMDTLLLSSITSFESDSPEITFSIPAAIKKDAAGKAICMKCHQTDEVYSIVYGLVQVVTRKKDAKGKIIYSNIANGKYYAGTCINGIATYYCDRDKVKF
jgi:hypothetical protein